jgi:phosphate:Na+ symporter
MWRLTHQAFLKHDLDLFPKIFEEENRLNDMEKNLTAELVALGRVSSSKSEKSQVIIYTEVVGDLELIGDYCKDILERVQIKIEEKLLFSDDAVKEYGELYRKTEDAMEDIVLALERDNPALAKGALTGQRHIDSLVDEYRQHHTQRLLKGVCAPFACNMFLNMLDFTAAVYYHARKIARNLARIK